jgi:hypothetical protein
MAQIGTPTAGWYTDPSGQHRARYWDGAGWTEQVRDDLTDPSRTNAPSAPPASPSPTEHPMVSTVAGVAEAVAAVAATDVEWPAVSDPEPPLVVDYGTDAPWGALPATNGAAPAVTDPFAAVAPLEPAPVVALVAPSAPAAPFVPAPAAPAAAWYPDPAARHQARLWDGTRWTERVADNGVEGIDPLPGASVAATTVDPTVGAWSSELLGTAEAAAPLGPDGKPVSAGQISLATLPEVERSESEVTRPAARPTPKVRVAGGFVLGGAIALLAGSAMPWMEVTGPKVGDAWTATGLDLGDGRITVALALVLAVLGAAIITGRMTRFGGTKVAAMGALVAGAAALAVVAVDIADVADRATRLGVPVGAVSNVGSGLWLAFVGALFAVGGGLMAFANRQ